MAIMVTVFMFAARNVPPCSTSRWLAGVIYGLITYVVMNLVVVPLRFGGLPPSRCRSRPNCSPISCWSAWPTALITARRSSRA